MTLSLPAWLHIAKVPPCLGTNCSTICSVCHRISTVTHATSAPLSASPLLSLSRPSFLYHCTILCVICKLHQPYICGCLEPPQQKLNYLSSGELPVMICKQQHSKPPVWDCWHSAMSIRTFMDWNMLNHNTCYNNFSQTLKFKIWINISKATNTTQMYCIYLFIYSFIHLLIHSHTIYFIYLQFTVPDTTQFTPKVHPSGILTVQLLM